MVERLRGRAGQAQRDRRLRAHGVHCARCGRIGVWKQSEASDVLPLLVVDHEQPLALGGSDDDGNTRVLCTPCHDEVTREQFGQRAGPRLVGTDAEGWPAGA